MQELADNDLMIMYRDGDYSAFEVLYRRHRSSLMRYLERQLSPKANAEEVFQEVWLRLIALRERYKSTAKFKTFLFHIAHNCLVDYYRKLSRTKSVSLDTDPELAQTEIVSLVEGKQQNNPEQAVSLERKIKTLLELVKTLPNEQRDSYLLKEEGGVSIEDIAKITKTTAETAKSRIRYATAKLRKGLEAVYGQI